MDTLLTELDENLCEVDWVERDQLHGLPPTLVDDIVGDVSDQNLRDACARVTSTEGKYAYLRARFRRDQNGVIYLAPIDGSLWDR